MSFLSRIPIFLTPAVLFASCVSRAPTTLQGSFGPGKPRYHIELDSAGRKHGVEAWWFDNGNPRYRARNVHGLRDGMYQAWYTDGTPWYQGRDSLGVPVDTLFGWRPNGRLERIQVFEAGETLAYEAVDTSGISRAERLLRDADDALKARDSLEAFRRVALSDWARRVRASVETYWIPPKRTGLQAHRAVASLRVAPDGRVLKVGWIERSASKAFNERADRALRRVKKLPPLPPGAVGEPIDLRYEFVSAGGVSRRARSLVPADTGAPETTLD